MFLRLWWRAYDFTLRFYPAELRESFGAEMSEIFRQQTVDARAEGGWAMARVLYYAFSELFTRALPARAEARILIAGAGSFVCTSAIFWCLLWIFRNPLAANSIEHHVQRMVCGG